MARRTALVLSVVGLGLSAGAAARAQSEVVVRTDERSPPATARSWRRTSTCRPRAARRSRAGTRPCCAAPRTTRRAEAETARWFAARGYAVVVNDCRGRFGSEGRWRMLLDDPADGADVMKWIAEQPWSTGKVGTFGTSYVGGTQHALACADPPGLACMIPVDSVSNAGLAGIRHGGAFELRFFNWAFLHGGLNSREALADPALQRRPRPGGEARPAAPAAAARSGPARPRSSTSRTPRRG